MNKNAATTTRSINYFLTLLAASLLLVQCGKPGEEPTPPEPTPAEKSSLQISASIEAITRVNDSGFENGDAVGIYVVDYTDALTPGTLVASANRATNTAFTYNSSQNKWDPASTIYWKDETTKADVYGYSPRNTTAPSSVTAYPFSVALDQSTASGYFGSDFLWAKTPNVAPQSTPVGLTFGHKMSKIVITLAAGTGFDDGLPESGISVRVLGTKAASTIDLTDGSVTVSAPATAQTITALSTDDTYRAIIVPQTVAAATPLIEVTVGGDVYTYTTDGYTFVPNKQHNFTITLNQTVSGQAISITSNSITPWETDPVTQTGSATNDASERQALVDLYNAAGGNNWSDHTNWCTDAPLGEWTGVTVDANGHVTELYIYNGKLNGTLPNSLGRLTYLEALTLGGGSPGLTGIFPSWICSLTNLKTLSLNTYFTGTIPAEIGNLVDLEKLSISSNSDRINKSPSVCLSGVLPPSITNLTKLKQFTLSGLCLSGNVSPEIFTLTNLEYLMLSNTGFSGNIPSEIGNLTKLKYIYIGENTFSGTIPASIGNLTALTSLSLSGNGLSGPVPSEIGNLTNLTFLNFGRWSLHNANDFGTLPSSIGNLTNLTSLYAQGCNLSSLPESLSNLTRLAVLWIGNNQFTTLPDCIQTLPNLRDLWAYGNQLTAFPAWITDLTNLQTLYLQDNQLAGTIPSGIGSLSNLNYLNLNGNQLVGLIPSDLKDNSHWSAWRENIIDQQEGFGFDNP